MTIRQPIQAAPTPASYLSRLFATLGLWRHARKAAVHDDALFIWIPKNAGTSVYTMLHEAGLVKLNSTPAVRRYFQQSGRVTFGHMSIGSLVESGLVSRDFADGAFKFALRRDPYTRAQSLYRVTSKLFVNWRSPPDFRAFLKILADGHYDRIGPYNRRDMSACNPQVEWLRDASPDKLYRMEELGEFVRDISERWDIPRPQLVHANRSNPAPGDNLDREERALIEKVYAEDFKTFGYAKR